MTGIPDLNFPAFDEAAEKLREAGYEVINPAEVDRSVGIIPTTDGSGTEDAFHDAMRRDIPLVMKADGVAMLPGWRSSRGANIEHDVAKAIGNPAMMVDVWLYEAALNRSRIVNR